MITVDLSGPQGNAFALMGIAKQLAEAKGLDGKAIIEEMSTGNYEHLLSVFEKYFQKDVLLENGSWIQMD